MKRSWFSVVILAGVIGLLTLFLGLQYRWLSEASEAERDRMQKRVETDTARFAEDFNREMQAAYYNFQTDAGTWKKSDWTEFNERYEFWKQRTPYPELIRSMYFFDATGNQPMIYNAAEHWFEPTSTTPELDDLRARFSDEKTFKQVYDDKYALVVPVYEGEKRIEHVILRRRSPGIPSMREMPPRFGWLLIMLDEEVIKGRILPDLAAKYFSEGSYTVGVFDKSEQAVFSTRDAMGTGSDARSQMFNMSPDNLLFFAGRDALPKIEGEQKHDVVVSQRVESHTFSRTETRGGKTFKIEVQQPPEKGLPRTAMIASTSETTAQPWTLRVQHVSGSIDAFVTGQRNKSFAIGLGIYLLLVGALVAIVLSALRSKRFAQRQIDFVSSVSHEFRTPLAVIYSAGENLADGVAKEDTQVSRYGELIKNEGKKLSGMVEQILEFAGANSGRRSFNFVETDVSNIVNDALEECRPLIESNGFTVETDVPSDLSPIRADKGALSSAIQNLILNSVKYSDGVKWIRVAAANGGDSVKISVEDKGIGIETADLRSVFEPFYRAKNVVDAQISGNGLGLNLVKKIVEAHGGKVTAVSKPGSGSTFTIELPQN